MRGPMLPAGWSGNPREHGRDPVRSVECPAARPAVVPRSIDTALFDLGGVVLRNGGPDDFMRRFPDLDPAVVLPDPHGRVREDTDHPWHRLERGEITMIELHDANVAALAAAGLPSAFVSPTELAFEVNDEMVALIEELRATGLRTGLLDQQRPRSSGRSGGRSCRSTSCSTTSSTAARWGCASPTRPSTGWPSTGSGPTRSRSVFLDDIASNVDAAERVGMAGVLVEPGGSGGDRERCGSSPGWPDAVDADRRGPSWRGRGRDAVDGSGPRTPQGRLGRPQGGAGGDDVVHHQDGAPDAATSHEGRAVQPFGTGPAGLRSATLVHPPQQPAAGHAEAPGHGPGQHLGLVVAAAAAPRA